MGLMDVRVEGLSETLFGHFVVVLPIAFFTEFNEVVDFPVRQFFAASYAFLLWLVFCGHVSFTLIGFLSSGNRFSYIT